MDETLRAHRDGALALLDRLIVRGRHIIDRLNSTSDSASDIRAWQQDCAVAVNELSGGSKAHWLSRAFSRAFLVAPSSGGVVVEASPIEIVERLLDVLAQAKASLAGLDSGDVAAGGSTAREPRRFDFVHNAELRPVLERAYVDSRRAFEEGDFQRAMLMACSALEAVITDALQAKGLDVSEWTFEARIERAEREGLIRFGCARLPAGARRYRDNERGATTSERDARIAHQVLRVVMRDLDPGR